jgi:hypothetical protein
MHALRYRLAAVLAALGVAVIAGLLVSAGFAPADAAGPDGLRYAPVTAHLDDPDPLIAALIPGGEVTDARAETLLIAADQVCEGLTADVPIATMTTQLVYLGMTGEEARAFVDVADRVHC